MHVIPKSSLAWIEMFSRTELRLSHCLLAALGICTSGESFGDSEFTDSSWCLEYSIYWKYHTIYLPPFMFRIISSDYLFLLRLVFQGRIIISLLFNAAEA